MTMALAMRDPVKLQKKRAGGNNHSIAKRLPEFLDKSEVDAIIRLASPPEAALIILTGFRAGLRISETLALETGDISLDTDYPTIRVRRGKGNRARIVPIHAELANALTSFMRYRPGRNRKLFDCHRATVHKWIKNAVAGAESNGAIPKGKRVSSHTFRHSAARWWLQSGVPINAVQLWLGHSSLQTTLIYLQILGDVSGFMERVP